MLWTIQCEDFPAGCLPMIHDHLREVRPELLPSIAFDRYLAMQRDGRLIWITARMKGTGNLVGFSGHWWYRDLHFDIRVGHDDLWHVERSYRGLGVGRQLREMGLAELNKAGAVYTSDHLRESFGKDDLMSRLGYHVYGKIWRKPLT